MSPMEMGHLQHKADLWGRSEHSKERMWGRGGIDPEWKQRKGRVSPEGGSVRKTKGELGPAGPLGPVSGVTYYGHDQMAISAGVMEHEPCNSQSSTPQATF